MVSWQQQQQQQQHYNNKLRPHEEARRSRINFSGSLSNGSQTPSAYAGFMEG